jgi:hypothetical protein
VTRALVLLDDRERALSATMHAAPPAVLVVDQQRHRILLFTGDV